MWRKPQETRLRKVSVQIRRPYRTFNSRELLIRLFFPIGFARSVSFLYEDNCQRKFRGFKMQLRFATASVLPIPRGTRNSVLRLREPEFHNHVCALYRLPSFIITIPGETRPLSSRVALSHKAYLTALSLLQKASLPEETHNTRFRLLTCYISFCKHNRDVRSYYLFTHPKALIHKNVLYAASFIARELSGFIYQKSYIERISHIWKKKHGRRDASGRFNTQYLFYISAMSSRGWHNTDIRDNVTHLDDTTNSLISSNRVTHISV